MMCNVNEGNHGYVRCTRNLLQGVQEDAQKIFETTFLIGFEIEFYITESSNSSDSVPTVPSLWSTASLRNPYFKVVEDSVRILEKAGISIWAFHSEGDSGMFEISTLPLPPVCAADALIYAHETIKSMAYKHGFHATIHPKPFEKRNAVGSHIHLSLSSSQNADHFLAGLLRSIPAICAFSMPQIDSYERSRSSPGGGGKWVSWGPENRSCPIRKIKDAHWEIRCIDGTANIYLTLAAILGAGLAGIERKEELKMKGKLSWTVGEDERKELGITKMLPQNVLEAVEALKGDTVVQGVVGKGMWERYVLIREKEEEKMSAMTRQERREVIMRNF